MTDERIEGAMRQGAGRLQDAVGGLTGDTKTQVKGKINQAAGAIQDTYGQVTNAVTDNFQNVLNEVQALAKTRPLAAVGIGVALGLVAGMILGRSRD